MNRLIVCLAALVVLAGCGEQPAAKSTPSSPTSRASASASATEPAPAIPRAAKANTEDGATAFVHYFFDLHNYAMRTGETTELRRAIAPECFVCLTMPALIEATYRGGGHISGGLWIPTTELYAVPNTSGDGPKDHALFEVSIRLQPMKAVAADDREVTALDGSVHDRRLLIWTSWRKGRWYLDQVNGVSGQSL